MVEITQLWLPVLLSGVAVFFISFCMWMVLPHHRSDWSPLPDEDGQMSKLREMRVTPGQYTFPHCATPAQMKDPEWMNKYNAGPKGYLIVLPEGPTGLPEDYDVDATHTLSTVARRQFDSPEFDNISGLEPNYIANDV